MGGEGMVEGCTGSRNQLPPHWVLCAATRGGAYMFPGVTTTRGEQPVVGQLKVGKGRGRKAGQVQQDAHSGPGGPPHV